MTAARTTVYPPAVLARVRRAKCWRLTAWHEAGHAVARLAYGLAVRSVELFPTGHPDGLLGVCRYAGRVGRTHPETWPARRVERWLVCGLAGGEAERLLVGRNSSTGRGHDDFDTSEWALYRCGGDIDAANTLIDRMQTLTRSLIQANRAAFRGVADALLASDRLALTGREVRQAAGDLVEPRDCPGRC